MSLDDFEGDPPLTRAFDLTALAATARPREVTGATFSYVDAMLTGRMSPSDLDRIRAEILGAGAAAPRPDPLRPVRDLMERLDWSGALRAAEELLERTPPLDGARPLAEECRARLADLYQSHVGRGGDVPRLAVSLDALAEQGIDRWSAYLLSRMQGGCTIDELVDVTGFTRLDTLRVLYELVQRGLVTIDRAAAAPAPTVLARVRLERRSR